MKRIKKLIAFAVVLALAVFTFGCAKQENTAENDYTEIYNQTSVTLTAESDSFKVLKINDTHFINGTCKNDKKTLEVLKGVLDKTECDLIICDGDIIEGNKKRELVDILIVSIFPAFINSYAVFKNSSCFSSSIPVKLPPKNATSFLASLSLILSK